MALQRREKRAQKTFGGGQRYQRARGQRGTEEKGIHGCMIRRDRGIVNSAEG